MVVFHGRAGIVHDGKLIVGSVRAVGDYRNEDASGWGNEEIAGLRPRLGKGPADRVATATCSRTITTSRVSCTAGRPLSGGVHAARRRAPQSTTACRSPAIRWCGDRWRHSTRREIQRARCAATTSPTRTVRGFRSHHETSSRRRSRSNYMYSDDSGRTVALWRPVGHGRDGYSPYLKYGLRWAEHDPFVMTEDTRAIRNNRSITASCAMAPSTVRRAAAQLSETTNVEINAWDLTNVFAGRRQRRVGDRLELRWAATAVRRVLGS